MPRKVSITKRIGAGLLLVIVVGYFIPECLVVPVDGATVSDWNEDTYWYEPWQDTRLEKDVLSRPDLQASGGPWDLSLPDVWP